MQRSDSKDHHMFDEDDLMPPNSRLTLNSNLKDELDQIQEEDINYHIQENSKDDDSEEFD